MYLLGGDFEGMLIREKCWYMAQFEVYFDTIFPQKFLAIFTYCPKISYCSKAFARESGKRISGAIWSKSY